MDIGIIGCGASGMMAAVTAAENGHNVTVLEGGDRPGKKLLATGNGKCNFTNSIISEDCYNEEAGGLFHTVYSQFDLNDTLAFFEKIGVYPHIKNGYYYPRSEQAASVTNCFLNELNRLNVDIEYNCKVISVTKDDKFHVKSEKTDYEFDRLIICAGSNAYPNTGSDGSGYGLAIKLGHFIKKPLPSLCGLKLAGEDFKLISGVRCQAEVSIVLNDGIIKSETGELQIADYGISGIPVFQISGKALRLADEGKIVQILVDYGPEYTEEEWRNILYKRARSLSDTHLLSFLDGLFNSKLAERIIYNSDLLEQNIKVSETDADIIAEKLIKSIKYNRYTVKGHRGFDNCQVCTGGVVLNEVKETLESRIVDGLYFAGEILDVDGICGGYNLQWAWSSGFVAGSLK